MKPWWLIWLTSRGVLGGLAAVIAGAFGLGTEGTASVQEMLTSGVSIAGGMLAIYGRWKASQPLPSPKL